MHAAREGVPTMSSKERNRSIWLETAGASPDWPALDGDLDVDVAVVGAGIAGLLSAVLLSEAGLRVAVVEADRVGAGVTGFSTAKVTSQHGLHYRRLARRHGMTAARTYGEANQAGLDEIARVVDEHDIDCAFTRAAAYVYATTDDERRQVEREADVSSRAGLPSHLTTETELPFPIRAALRFDGQAHVQPVELCRGLAEVVTRLGGEVFERTRAVSLDDGVPSRLRTDRGDVHASWIVLATQLPFVYRGLYFATNAPRRSYAVAVELDAPPVAGMYLSAGEPIRSLRPTGHGRSMLVGGEGHKVGQDPDERLHYQQLIEWAQDHFDVRAITHRWSAQDFMPVDAIPFIGAVPMTRRLLVMTGFQKWGFTTAGAAARILCDRVVGTDNPWRRLFDAGRVPVRGADELVRENANVAVHILSDRLAALRTRSRPELEPGEGTLMQQGLRAVAVARDDDGHLHTLDATCPHLGCTVRWNTAERSWDCPCHGSRFAVDGSLLQGPAKSDLKPLDRPE